MEDPFSGDAMEACDLRDHVELLEIVELEVLEHVDVGAVKLWLDVDQ